MRIKAIIEDEARRQQVAPVTANQIFLGHAGVSPLPQAAVEAMQEYLQRGAAGMQENAWTSERMKAARKTAAELIGCSPVEIALLGPTALGLSLVANGMPWQDGDEVVYYQDDYPANVYPWLRLRERGVRAVSLVPEHPGAITWELVEAALTPKTRLVSLTSCSFLSGYRIDVETIGRNLRERGILFCLDAIQSLGAFPLSVEHVDFLSADSHKWLLGPSGAGIVYVKKDRFDLIEPTLVGSWNVNSPSFIAQEELVFPASAQRYEPGTLNVPGIIGMEASMRWLLDLGIAEVGRRLLHLRTALLDRARPLGYRLYLEDLDRDPATPDSTRSGIVTLTHPDRDMAAVAAKLGEANIVASLRQNRAGEKLLRFSPHFYNTEAELDRVANLLGP